MLAVAPRWDGGGSSADRHRHTNPCNVQITRGNSRKRQGNNTPSHASREPRNHPGWTSLPTLAVAGRVTSYLADVPGRLPGIPDSVNSDRPLPSSAGYLSTTATTKQQAGAHKAAAAARRESSRVSAMKREYIQMNVTQVYQVNTMLPADDEDSGQFTSKFKTISTLLAEQSEQDIVCQSHDEGHPGVSRCHGTTTL